MRLSTHSLSVILALLLTGSMLMTGSAIAAPRRAAASGARAAAAAAVVPTAAAITVSPTTATPGMTVTVSGTGFNAGESITIDISGTTGALTTATASSSGALPSTAVMIPYTTTAGTHTISATGESSHSTATAALTVNAVSATLTVTPSSAATGSTVSVSGTNWAPNEAITITLSGETSPITVTHANGSGDLPATTLAIPYSAATGQQTLTATGAVSKRTATATISITQVSATLVVTPTVTNRGGLVTVSGGDFAPNEGVTITIQGIATPLAMITATAQGALPPTGFSIPYSVPVGSHTLQVTGAISKRTASAAITVQQLTPSISLSASSVSPGARVTVSGKGFGREEQVTLALNGAALATAPAVITTTNGAFTASFVAPDSLLRGLNTISAIGNESRVSAIANLTGVRSVATTMYFAGATTMPGEQARLPILNTNGEPAHIDLTFYYQSGGPGHASLDVPAHSRGTADLNKLAGGNRRFGVKMTADRSVTAALHVSRSGKDDYSLLGAAAPNTTWYLAEGYTGLTFHETLTLVNPGPSPAQVSLRLLPFGGRAARTVSVTVGAQSDQSVDVNSLMPKQSLSVIAHSSQPIVLARTLTFSNDGFGITAKTGTNSPATSWIFAEGTTTTRFQTFLTILNPNTVAALVTASFYGQTGGSLGSRTVLVPALSRANIKLNDFLHASGIASVVTSNLPVVVERPEYFGSPNDAYVAGSDVFGRNGAGLNWTFPGGNTGGHNEYLLIYNPSPRTVDINATFYGSDGKTTTKRIFVPPTVRYNVNVNASAPGVTPQHSITLHGTNGLGFVAEQTVFAPDFSSLASTEGFAQ